MRNHRIWPQLLCVLPILVLMTVQASLASPPQWVEIRSAHFTIITDASEERGREVAARFEDMRTVFGAYMSKPNLSLPAPLQIVAFRNTKEMRQFVPRWQGKPIDMMGYFHQSGDCGVILLDLSVKNYVETAFHEYAHQLLNANTSMVTQPWFDEGFAEYFSTIRSRDGQAEIGALHRKDWKVVRHKPLVSTAELLQVRQDSAIYNQNGDARNVFYGQSWLMVHYLFDTQSLPRAFDYFARIAQGTTGVEDAFQQAFGMSTQEFDQVLARYARQKTLETTVVPFETTAVPGAIEVRTLSPTDADAQLADVHLHSPDYDDHALREFDSVLKRDPKQAVALRGLGYAYLQDRDFARAADFLKRAEMANPDDARVHYYTALLIKEEAGVGGQPSGENLSTMQRELQRAVSLAPDYAAAYQLLALLYEWQGKAGEGLEAVKRAVELSPRSRSYRADLARLGGDAGAASLILKQLDARAPSATQAQFGQSKTGGPSAPAK